MPTRIKRNVGKPKYYRKARTWFSVKGQIKVAGFERIAVKKEGPYLIVGKRNVAIAPWAPYEEPLFAFRATAGSDRIIIVGKRIEKTLNRVKIEINAYCGTLGKSERTALERFASANAKYYPKYNAVVGSDFVWWGSDRKYVEGENQEIWLTPEWLKGKGFGLFLDSIRTMELAKLGVRKWFAPILQNPYSREFAELRGFRKLTKEEVEVLRKILRKESIESIERTWRVKDILPIKGSGKGKGILPKE